MMKNKAFLLGLACVVMFSVAFGISGAAGFGEIGTGACKCLSYNVSVNSTNRTETLYWTLVSTYNFPINFYVQPAILTTPGASNMSNYTYTSYKFAPNSTQQQPITIFNNESVSVHYKITSFSFMYYNTTTHSEDYNITSVNFSNSQTYPVLAYNKTEGVLQPHANTTVLTQVQMPTPNNRLYNALVTNDILNANTTIILTPIAPIVTYGPLNGTIIPNGNYTINVTVYVPQNITTHHLWQGLATAFATSTKTNESGGQIQLGTAKGLEIRAVTSTPKTTTTIATIVPTSTTTTITNTSKQVATTTSPSINSTDLIGAAVVVVLIVVILALVLDRSRKNQSKSKR